MTRRASGVSILQLRGRSLPGGRGAGVAVPAILRGSGRVGHHCCRVARDEPESLIFREELTSTMFVIRDIASDVRQYGNCSRETMARKRDKERAEQDARLEDFSRILERAKADLVAGGETVLTPEEWELPIRKDCAWSSSGTKPSAPPRSAPPRTLRIK